MEANDKTYENILEEYLERVGKNLVGAILIDKKTQVIALTLRNKKVKNEKLEEVLEKVQAVIKGVKDDNKELDLNSKSIETSDYLILLTQVNQEIILISLFALNAMIDSFVAFTQIASKKLKKMIEDFSTKSKDSEELKNTKIEEKQTITRLYNCQYCNTIHNIDLSKDLLDGKDSFPFPYVFLHSSQAGLRDLLTTLYIDKNFNIRAAEVVQVENGDIFSEKLTRRITEKLMKEIEELEQENKDLRDLLKNIDLQELKEKEDQTTMKLASSKDKLQVWKKSKNNVKNVFVNLVADIEKRKFVHLDKNRKVSHVRKIASQIFKLPTKHFYVTYGGMIMVDHLKIVDYGIKEGEHIVLIPARYNLK
jgi:hypothetical protein